MADRNARVIRIPVRVQARSRRCEIRDVRDGRLRITTTALPVDGEANRDVARQLANAFGVPPSRVALHTGGQHRNKTFLVTDPARWPDWLTSL